MAVNLLRVNRQFLTISLQTTIPIEYDGSSSGTTIRPASQQDTPYVVVADFARPARPSISPHTHTNHDPTGERLTIVHSWPDAIRGIPIGRTPSPATCRHRSGELRIIRQSGIGIPTGYAQPWCWCTIRTIHAVDPIRATDDPPRCRTCKLNH